MTLQLKSDSWQWNFFINFKIDVDFHKIWQSARNAHLLPPNRLNLINCLITFLG